MTTISSNSIPGAGAISPLRTAVTGNSESYLGKPRALTAEEAAVVAQLTAGKSKPGAEAGSPPPVATPANGEWHLGKPRAMTAEEKAEVGRIMANSAAVNAASEKQRLEIAKSMSAENNSTNLPNIAGLSLDDAKMTLDVTQMMIESERYKGIIVNGHNGDQQISDFGTYKAALIDYINNHHGGMSKAAGEGATAATQAGTTAAATYRQMQALTGKGGSEG